MVRSHEGPSGLQPFAFGVVTVVCTEEYKFNRNDSRVNNFDSRATGMEMGSSYTEETTFTKPGR